MTKQQQIKKMSWYLIVFVMFLVLSINLLPASAQGGVVTGSLGSFCKKGDPIYTLTIYDEDGETIVNGDGHGVVMSCPGSITITDSDLGGIPYSGGVISYWPKERYVLIDKSCEAVNYNGGICSPVRTGQITLSRNTELKRFRVTDDLIPVTFEIAYNGLEGEGLGRPGDQAPWGTKDPLKYTEYYHQNDTVHLPDLNYSGYYVSSPWTNTQGYTISDNSFQLTKTDQTTVNATIMQDKVSIAYHLSDRYLALSTTYEGKTFWLPNAEDPCTGDPTELSGRNFPAASGIVPELNTPLSIVTTWFGVPQRRDAKAADGQTQSFWVVENISGWEVIYGNDQSEDVTPNAILYPSKKDAPDYDPAADLWTKRTYIGHCDVTFIGPATEKYMYKIEHYLCETPDTPEEDCKLDPTLNQYKQYDDSQCVNPDQTEAAALPIEGYTAREPIVQQDLVCSENSNIVVKVYYDPGEPETKSIRGKKTWNDEGNRDNTRPESITVKLTGTASGGYSKVYTQTVSADENDKWEYVFKDLPVKHEGNLIKYVISEDVENLPEGYTSEVDGFNITNTYVQGYMSLKVTKTWVDNQDAADLRSEVKAKVKLYKTVDETKTEVDSKDVPTNKDTWDYTWPQLPVYDGGKLITYSVEEILPTGCVYEKEGDGVAIPAEKDKNAEVAITNTYTPPAVTSITVSKIWNDNENSEGKRSESEGATVQLWMQVGNAEPQLYSNDQFSVPLQDDVIHTWEDLPVYSDDETQTVIQYFVVETLPTGSVYTKSGDGADNFISANETTQGEITITNSYETVKVDTSALWKKKVEGTGFESKSFEFTLSGWTNNGNKIEETKSLSFSESGEEFIPFETILTLTRDDIDHPIVLTVKESADSEDGWDFDSRLNKYGRSITVTVEEDADGKLVANLNPETQEFLNKYGKYVVTYKVTGPAVCNPYPYDTTEHTYTYYEPLAQYAETYGVVNNLPVEEPIPTCEGYTFYADHRGTGEVYEWKDLWWYEEDNPQYWRCAGRVNGQACVVGWVKGELITYNHLKGIFIADPITTTLEFGQKTVYGSGYDTTTFNFTLTPKETPDGVTQAPISTDVEFTDNGQTTQTKPINFTITYEKAGTYTYEITETAVNGWTEISTGPYEVIVDVVEGEGGLHATVRTGTKATLTNTLLTSKSVKKIWADGNDKDGLRPESLTVKLSNGTETVATETLDSSNSWTVTVTDLPMYNGENEIVYTWTEELPEGSADYDLAEGVLEDGTVTLTNTLLTSKSVKKIWHDGKSSHDELTVNLLANGNATGKSVKLNETNHWEDKLDELDQYDDQGNEITYTWAEVELEGYSVAVSKTGTTTTLTNTLLTEATVKKVWNDSNNQDGKRPASLTVKLSNGTEKTLNEANGWTATVEKLPMYDEKGVEIEYTWSETNMPEGYTLTGNDASGTVTTLTNTHEPEKTEATVQKVWDDDNNAANKRPASLTVTLSNGTVVTLNEANGWSATVTDLPKYANGAEIAYTWTEGTVAGYTFGGATVSGTVTTLTNRVIPTYDVEIIYVDIETGEEIHERVTIDDLEPGDPYSVTDPEIPGYVSLNDGTVVSGTITNRNITIVRYFAPVRVPGGPVGGGEPSGEGDPEPPLLLYTLVDIADLETPLGLGGLNINVGECIE